jgi:26S proteasome regulatory subunit N7
VLKVLPTGALEPYNRLIHSLYVRDYAVFFLALAEVEQLLKVDRYLAPHTRIYVREMRCKAYAQLLESYKILSIVSMAELFGVTLEWLEEYNADGIQVLMFRDLNKFISSKKLNCIIDRVDGCLSLQGRLMIVTVETTRVDSRNAQYQDLIKEGDLLLNKIQKYQAVVRFAGAKLDGPQDLMMNLSVE